jgi:hypothetical protein
MEFFAEKLPALQGQLWRSLTTDLLLFGPGLIFPSSMYSCQQSQSIPDPCHLLRSSVGGRAVTA